MTVYLEPNENSENKPTKLTMVDLAGSERLDKNAQTNEEQLQDTKNINQSLFYFRCFLEDFAKK